MRTKIALLLGALTMGLLALAPPAHAATVPSAPNLCYADRVSASKAHISWTAPTDTGGSPITAYKIRRQSNTTPTVSVGAAVRSYDWTTAFSGTEVFQVRAVNAIGGSPWCSTQLNWPPVTNAGPDQTATLHADSNYPSGKSVTITMAGSVTDDGLGGYLTHCWSTPPPGYPTIYWGDQCSPTTALTLTEPGTYSLTLNGCESFNGNCTTDTMVVTVNDVPVSRPLLPYTSSSWLRTTTAGLTPDPTKTSDMIGYITTHDPNPSPNLQGLGGNAWGTSWGGVATCSDPVWKIGTGTVKPQNSFLTTVGFHASQQMVDDINAAAAAGGTDLPFEVIDNCRDSAWLAQLPSSFQRGLVVKGTQAQPVSGTNTINVGGYAGAYDLGSNGLAGPVTGSDNPDNWSSRGVIAASSTIRHDQLRYAVDNNGDLGQRLEIFWWETQALSGVINPPMFDFESGSARNGWGAEGQLIGIDKGYDASLCTNAAAAAIVRTLQNYGAYIGDNAGGGGTSLKMEQSHGQWADLSVSQRSLDTCAGLDWNDFVAY